MKKILQKIIVCPQCKKTLLLNGDKLSCKSCNKKYYFQNEIPIFYDEFTKIENMLNENKEAKDMAKRFFDRSLFNKIKMKASGLFFLSSKTMVSKLDYYRNINKKGLILNVGSGVSKIGDKDINLEIGVFKNVDIVGDAHNLPIASNSIDMVVCVNVLEHVKNPKKVVEEIKRVLKKNGIVFIQVPFIERFHEYPYDFQRFTIIGLKELMVCFKEVESGVAGGPTIALIELIIHYFKLISKNNVIIFASLLMIFSIPLYLFKFFDKFLIKDSASYEMAINLYYVGKNE